MTYKKYANSPGEFHWNGAAYKSSRASLFNYIRTHVWTAKLKGFALAKQDNEAACHSYIDHTELFRNENEWIVVAHLYDMHVDRNEHNLTAEEIEEDRQELREFAEKYNLEVHFLDDIPSWYYPRCTLVLWKDKDQTSVLQ